MFIIIIKWNRECRIDDAKLVHIGKAFQNNVNLNYINLTLKYLSILTIFYK